MAVEAARGCGYREVGGLYLVGAGTLASCDRMPYELELCPTCGNGIKFTRGFTWLDWYMYASVHIVDGARCKDAPECPVCDPFLKPKPYGLLWVGEQSYTPKSFINEALVMGVSRRIAAVPRKLKLGETWVLLAHKSACGERLETQDDETQKRVGIPGVFYAFLPKQVDYLIWESDATEERLDELEHKDITPIIIPDGDKDHDPKQKTTGNATLRASAETTVAIARVRSLITGSGR